MDVVFLRYEIKENFTYNYCPFKAGEQLHGWLDVNDNFNFKLSTGEIVEFTPMQRKRYLMPLSIGYRELKQDRFKGVSY